MEQVTIVSLAKGYSPLFSLYGNNFILEVSLSTHRPGAWSQPLQWFQPGWDKVKAFTTTSSPELISVFV